MSLIKESQKDVIRSRVSHIKSWGQSPPQSEEKWVNYIENGGFDFPEHRIWAIAAWAFSYCSHEQLPTEYTDSLEHRVEENSYHGQNHPKSIEKWENFISHQLPWVPCEFVEDLALW
eukprot:119015_1